MSLFGRRDRYRRVFELQALRLLRLIANRLEITMADIDTLNSEVAQVAADEAAIATDVKNVLDELNAQQAGNAPVDLSGPIAALSALHTKLQADDASLVAAEPPAPPTPVPVAPVNPDAGLGASESPVDTPAETPVADTTTDAGAGVVEGDTAAPVSTAPPAA